MAKRDDINYLLSKIVSMSESMGKLESSIGASSKSTKAFDSSLNSTAKYTQLTNTNLANMTTATQRTVMALGSLNSSIVLSKSNLAVPVQNPQQGQNPPPQQSSSQTPWWQQLIVGLGSAYAAIKLMFSLPDMISAAIPALINKVFGLISDSFTKISEVQAKGLGSNIKSSELFNTEQILTRSRLVDVQQELLKFRELGIKKFDESTVRLADRMIFTGQRVGSLAKFLTETGLAINLNTDQSEALAENLLQSTVAYGLQQDVLFEALNSMKDVLVSVQALTGKGQNVTELVAEYTSKFGAQYAGDIEKVLTFLLNDSNQTLIRMAGLGPEINKLLQKSLDAEGFKELINSALTQIRRIAPEVEDVLKFPIGKQQLGAVGVDQQLKVSLDNLGKANLLDKQAAEDLYKKLLTLKDPMLAIQNNIDKTTLGIFENFNESLSQAEVSLDKFRATIDVLFEKVRSGISDLLKDSAGVAKALVDGLNIDESIANKISEFLKSSADIIKVKEVDKNDPDAPKRVVKQDDMYKAREQQLKQFNPEQTTESTGFLAQMTSHLKGLKDNSDEQMKKLKYSAGRFMESPAMNRSV